MGVSLSHLSSTKVDAAVHDAILQESTAINRRRDWWCESINFFEHPDYPDRLVGNTRLFVVGYSTNDGGYVEVGPDEDSLMAWCDAQFIVSQLERWSAERGLAWDLSMEGEHCGGITSGKADSRLSAFLQDLREFAGVEGGEARIPELLARHASRNEPLCEPRVPHEALAPEAPSAQAPTLARTPRKLRWKFW